ncbi:MAG TPA: hypothetical protein VFR23_15150 [Jiangellaceae bacterium]|nr:hypothetical protein [Jiangellaceae bacterium]
MPIKLVLHEYIALRRKFANTESFKDLASALEVHLTAMRSRLPWGFSDVGGDG